jgi:hypothetical protein
MLCPANIHIRTASEDFHLRDVPFKGIVGPCRDTESTVFSPRVEPLSSAIRAPCFMQNSACAVHAAAQRRVPWLTRPARDMIRVVVGGVEGTQCGNIWVE